MSTAITIGLSIPKALLARIDRERGDVSRSRYLRRLVELAYARNKEEVQ